jgi:hypothetical protein
MLLSTVLQLTNSVTQCPLSAAFVATTAAATAATTTAATATTVPTTANASIELLCSIAVQSVHSLCRVLAVLLFCLDCLLHVDQHQL